MILGRSIKYMVLAVVLVTAVLLLAVPAWSQDETSKRQDARAKDSNGQTGSAKTGESSEQTISKKTSGVERTTEKTEESSARERINASNKDNNDEKDSDEASKKATSKEASGKKKNGAANKDPLKKADIEVRKDANPEDEEVDANDVLVIEGNYKIKPDATVRLKDKDGTKAKLANDENATMETGSLKITVDGAPSDVSGGNGVLNTTDLMVVGSTGVRFVSDGRRGDGRGRGGRGAKIDCDINSGDPAAGFQQYSIEQFCIIERGGGGGGRGPDFPPFDDGFGFDFDELFEEEDEEIQSLLEELADDDEEDVTVQIVPDGEVQDTSVIEVLPNTGGPGFAGGATIAGLALLGTGAGVSVWRLRNRRG